MKSAIARVHERLQLTPELETGFAALQACLLRLLSLDIPKHNIKHLQFSLLCSDRTNLADPNDGEGASLDRNHVITQRVPLAPWNNDLHIQDLSAKSDFGSIVWVMKPEELPTKTKHPLAHTDPIINILHSRMVHETLHDITLHTLWKKTWRHALPILDNLTNFANDVAPSVAENLTSRKNAINKELFLGPFEYMTSYERNRELQDMVLSFLPENYHLLYLRGAFAHAISEMISWHAESSARPISEPLESYYASNFYASSITLALPTPQHHQNLLPLLRQVRLPLDAQAFAVLNELGHDKQFARYLRETQ